MDSALLIHRLHFAFTITYHYLFPQLAMEGVFAFFMESAFLGLFLYGEKRLSRTMHWFSAFAVFFGSWLSGYFIVATDAWMQHPVGYRIQADGSATLQSFWSLVLNPW